MELRRTVRRCFATLFLLLPLAAAGQEGAAAPPAPQPANPDPPEVAEQLRVGNAQLKAGHPKEALAAFSEADRLAGGRSFSAAVGLATAHFRSGAPQSARPYAERAVALAAEDLDRGTALNLVGLAYFQSADGKPDELRKAIAPLEQGIALGGPSLYASRLTLAYVRDGLGESETAVADLRGLLATLPAKHIYAKEARTLLCHIRFRHPAIAEPARAKARDSDEKDVVQPERIFEVQPELNEAVSGGPTPASVAFKAVIDSEGCVTDIQPPKNLTPEKSAAARQALAQWVFLPATLKGVPVAVYYTLTASFH